MHTLDICNNLNSWFKERNYKGIDPYLIDQAIPSKTPFIKNLRTLLKPFHSHIPQFLFKRFKPVLMPKALGLLISGNCSLYKLTKDKKYLEENGLLIKLLVKAKSKAHQGSAWGWPFNHGDSPRYYADLPITCVTAPIGYFLLEHYELTKNKNVLALVKSVCDYIIEESGYDDFGDEICFRHTTLDNNLVHNSNLFIAALLLKANMRKDLAKKAIRYSLNKQNLDGSWNYFGENKTGKDDKIDNRHTGFVLEALMKCGIKNEKGLEFYRKKLMVGSRPKWSVEEEFPCDIHDVTQALITFTLAGEKEYASQIKKFMLKSFYNGKNGFYYKLFQNGTKNKTIFLRWNQAWAYKSLALYLEKFGDS